LFLVGLQQFANYGFQNNVMPNPPVLSVNKIPKCYGEDCVTLGIAFTNSTRTPLSMFVMKHLEKHQDLELGKSMKIIANDYDEMIDYLETYPNKTQTVVLFCTGEMKIPEAYGIDGTFDCLRETPGTRLALYSMIINSTITPLMFLAGFNAPTPIDYASLSVKLAMDSAIFDFYSGSSDNSQKFKGEVQHYPITVNRYLNGYDIVTDVGVFYFYIPPMVTFVVLLIEIVREKEYRMRHGLAVMGMTPGPYWLSWFVTGFVFSFLVTNSLIISSLACQFDIFLYTPYPIMLFIFMMFSLAMINGAFLLSTIIKTTKSAYTSSYAVILIGLVLQFLLSDVNIIYLLYSDDLPNWALITRGLLSLYAPFHFSKAFGDIAAISSSHYESSEGRWVEGDKYSFESFTKEIRTTVAGTGVNVPSTFTSVLLIIADGLLLAIIAWYLDHVLPSNRGTADKPWFFITPSYWGCRRRKPKTKKSRKSQNFELDNMKGPCPSVEEIDEDFEGVSIEGLGKIFKSCSCCKCPSLHAVNDLSLEIKQKELLALLGHNGAGKSTLINLLTGVLSPSYGKAKIFGYDIRYDMSEIRKILGVCPQHDILWSELTAFEHLVLFGRIKLLPYQFVYEDAEAKLKELNLFNVKDKPAGTFSGGMKRRLSLAIAGCGNPKIIILDEPTTGMDPINRRNAWKLIQKMKEGRVVILTTHSMEEADVLSDRVSVIVDGSLKCIGSSLNLKNNFGDGYRISIISHQVDELILVLTQELPDLKILDSSGGSLVVGIPLDKVDQIEKFFRAVEGDQKSNESTKIKDLVDDWGISNTTLEEVFMRVTGKKVANILNN
jgi:ABC-type multidrug transport system ATPase subunit